MHPGQTIDLFLEACRDDERELAGVMLRELARVLRDKRPVRPRHMERTDRQLALIIDSLWQDVTRGEDLRRVELLFRTLLTWLAYREQAAATAGERRGKPGQSCSGPGEA